MISIIIPFFNSSETILETLKSALKSGVKGQEIILVNDGSTDNSMDIALEFQRNNNEVKVIKHDVNMGGGAARNYGIKHAKYEYIFILDSDDILVPNALNYALKKLIDENADGVTNSSAIFFKNDINSPVRDKYDYPKKWWNFSDLVSNIPNPVIGNLLYKKSAYNEVLGYPETHGFDTQGFAFRLLRNNKKIITGDDLLYYQRIPDKPSYYIRELKSGNINKNWFYILIESLYMFNESTREWILNYDLSDPIKIGKGLNIHAELANFEDNNIQTLAFYEAVINDYLAFKMYSDSNDPIIKGWLILYNLNIGDINEAIKMYKNIYLHKKIRFIYPLLSTLIDSGYQVDHKELGYIFLGKRDLGWLRRNYLQKIKNRFHKLFYI